MQDIIYPTFWSSRDNLIWKHVIIILSFCYNLLLGPRVNLCKLVRKETNEIKHCNKTYCFISITSQDSENHCCFRSKLFSYCPQFYLIFYFQCTIENILFSVLFSMNKIWKIWETGFPKDKYKNSNKLQRRIN